MKFLDDKKSKMEKFKKWVDALVHPKETFRKERERASFSEAIINIGIAGFIGGLFHSIFLITKGEELLSTLTFIIASVVIWINFLIIISGVLYIIAISLGGVGSFVIQTYLISLFYAPILIVSAIAVDIPFGGVITTFIGFYYLYLFTIALKETHQYNTKKAIFTWLLPCVVIFTIGIILWQMGAFVR